MYIVHTLFRIPATIVEPLYHAFTITVIKTAHEVILLTNVSKYPNLPFETDIKAQFKFRNSFSCDGFDIMKNLLC